MFKHLGLLSIILMWAGTYVLLKNHTVDPGKTISKHAAKSTQYHVVFATLELTVVVLFTLFVFGWFIPRFMLSDGYGIAELIGVTGTVVAALIADRGGWQGKLHGIGAYGMAMSLLAMNVFLIMSHEINQLTRIILQISTTYMFIGTFVAIIRPRLFRRNALTFQVAYFFAFQVPILLSVYS